MSKWKDTSSFSQGDKVRTPHNFTFNARGLRIVLHHYHGLGDAWFVSSSPNVVDMRPLESKDVEAAKAEALRVVTDVLESMLEGVQSND